MWMSQNCGGGYYTPEPVVKTLVRWAVKKRRTACSTLPAATADLLPPIVMRSVSSRIFRASREAIARAPWALVHEGEFFTWAKNTAERFDCAAGNPPFIRYQQFKGTVRDQALALCSEHGARFSGLTSSWAPFLVAVASLLKPSGRMAFVTPAEIGHAPYSVPLLEYLISNFSKIQVIAIKEKIFPELSEDCWLLYASGYGGSTDKILLSVIDSFCFMSAPPETGVTISVSEWRGSWRKRLRPYLMPETARQLYGSITDLPTVTRLKDLASVGIGYVTGANDFFHLKPSDAKALGIPAGLLLPSVRNGRMLRTNHLTGETVRQWYQKDLPVLLLRLTGSGDLPPPVRKYLDTNEGQRAQEAYKCRTRSPWYVVPDVLLPDYFLTYMSGGKPMLVTNDARCSCTNSLLAVQLRNKSNWRQMHEGWESPVAELSCELEGHALGGGMLKLEPREAAHVIMNGYPQLSTPDVETLCSAIRTMRSWRHCDKTDLPVGKLF